LVRIVRAGNVVLRTLLLLNSGRVVECQQIVWLMERQPPTRVGTCMGWMPIYFFVPIPILAVHVGSECMMMIKKMLFAVTNHENFRNDGEGRRWKNFVKTTTRPS
jgi:hypothetical protein